MEKSKLIDATRQYDTVTNNGAVTHSTSLNRCLDLFFLAGASRNISDEQIINLFSMAVVEDRKLAFRILFWARDCRGGAGEKRFFRVIAKWCSVHMKKEYDAVSNLIPEYGSWKDVFIIEESMINDVTLNWLSVQLMENPNKNLLAKYFPRKGPWFVAMHKHFGMSPKKFRKILVEMTDVVETKLCNKEYSEINYSSVPSVAMKTYMPTFLSKDEVRYRKYIGDVMDGKSKINASVLFPHQVIKTLRRDNVDACQAMWDALPNYMEDSSERILPVCDVSGSMSGLPMEVSIALGLYISERNKSIFKDAFITFSERPTMQYVQGNNLNDKVLSMAHADWGMSTNLQATFDLILRSAVRESIPESDMPTKLLIISDMEFDQCGSENTNLDVIRQKYAEAGYIMPEIIFWNVNGRVGNVPANKYDSRIGLVSGFSPSILKSILQGEVETPTQLMLRTVHTIRYEIVEECLDTFVD
jgi:hypothetical protein